MSANICNSPFDCDLEVITPEQVLRKLATVDSNGCPALRVVAAEAAGDTTCDNYITCDNAELSAKAMVMQMITVLESGCWALRIVISS